MEVIKIKCLNCMEITSVQKELMIQYEGKAVSIKCSNPQCAKPMKVYVPKLNTLTETRMMETAFDLPPTQIVNFRNKIVSSARLKVIKDERTEEQIFNLKEGLNTIGRLSMLKSDSIPDIPIFTSDKKMSRNHHCEIILQRKGDNYEAILRDNNSPNGTFLNDTKQALKPEDEIFLNDFGIFIIGETKIQIELK